MKKEIIAEIVDFLKENLDEVAEGLAQNILVGSCYSTVLAFKDGEIYSWLGSPDNRVYSMDETYVQFLTIDIVEEFEEDDESWIQAQVTEVLETYIEENE